MQEAGGHCERSSWKRNNGNKSYATWLEGDPLNLGLYPSLASPARSGHIHKTAHSSGDKKKLYKSLIAPLNGRTVVTGISPDQVIMRRRIQRIYYICL